MVTAPPVVTEAYARAGSQSMTASSGVAPRRTGRSEVPMPRDTNIGAGPPAYQPAT